jgi:uncharacterized ferritin-like protein (DUF455 family)
MTRASNPSTVEAWAFEYVSSTSLLTKIAPAEVPAVFRAAATPIRILEPGRPHELVVSRRSPHTPRPGALVSPVRRAQLLHTFWHHELQAAELMAWAILAFSDAELEFRRGLLRICRDEIRHMGLYQRHIEALGQHIGAFPVRDRFWKRVPSCTTKLSFVALMGMGFEAANLEHAPHFASQFRAAGDAAGGALQECIAEEEIFHVSFATAWFAHWTGGCSFETWRESLPPPLSPMTLRGPAEYRALRLRAGMPADFVAALDAWVPEETEARRAPG